jgi:hypothetical protein
MKTTISLIFLLFFYSLISFGIDLYPDPQLISVGEIYLLSKTPSTTIYQPATQTTGISMSHSNPFGYTELNGFQLAAIFKIRDELVSIGAITLDNALVSDHVYFAGYTKAFHELSIGFNTRWYHQTIDGYNTLNAFTINVGAIWENQLFSHGVSFSNVSHTSTDGILIPSIYKYECALSSFVHTSFAFAVEKERNYDIRYGFGVKQDITQNLTICSGMITESNQFSAGIIVKINKINVSCAMRTHGELGLTQAVGVHLKL